MGGDVHGAAVDAVLGSVEGGTGEGWQQHTARPAHPRARRGRCPAPSAGSQGHRHPAGARRPRGPAREDGGHRHLQPRRLQALGRRGPRRLQRPWPGASRPKPSSPRSRARAAHSAAASGTASTTTPTCTGPRGLDTAHRVPLGEAWESGAFARSDAERKAYANDLGDGRSLIAVTGSSNRAKGKKDPAEWQPPYASNTYAYDTDWVAVKNRWGQSIDPVEKTALADQLTHCPNVPVTFTLAR